MNTVVSSAPGKLMLFGEHAVVYGHPCIVTAVDQRMRVSVSFNGKGEIVVRAPQVGLERYSKKIALLGKHDVPKPVRFIELLVKNYQDQYGLERGLDIITESEFSADYGFGSSAAVTVALAYGLAQLHSLRLSNQQLFELCFKAVLDVQGVGSGFDIAASIYGGTLYYIKGGSSIQSISWDGDCPIVVGYTGIKADTPTLIRQVAEYRVHQLEKTTSTFEHISEIVHSAEVAFSKQQYKVLGKLATKNQKLLHSLGISSVELDRLISAAQQAGALGSKLSGAGGGDCMISFVSDKKREDVEAVISNAGGEVVDVRLHAQGVRKEKMS